MSMILTGKRGAATEHNALSLRELHEQREDVVGSVVSRA